jgi:hypothetical protein
MLLLAYRSRGYIFLIGVEDGCSTRRGSSERKKGKKKAEGGESAYCLPPIACPGHVCCISIRKVFFLSLLETQK